MTATLFFEHFQSYLGQLKEADKHFLESLYNWVKVRPEELEQKGIDPRWRAEAILQQLNTPVYIKERAQHVRDFHTLLRAFLVAQHGDKTLYSSYRQWQKQYPKFRIFTQPAFESYKARYALTKL